MDACMEALLNPPKTVFKDHFCLEALYLSSLFGYFQVSFVP